MFLYQPLKPPKLGSLEPAATNQPDGIEPELSDTKVPFDVNMWGLFTVPRVEEAAVRAISKYGRHGFGLS